MSRCAEIVREAQALIDLHDALMDEAAANNGEPPADGVERWCEAVDRLRALLLRRRQ